EEVCESSSLALLVPIPNGEGAPTNTLSPGQGSPRGAGGSLGQSEPGSPALQPHTTDGSPRVVGRTVEPFLVFGEPCPVAFWSFRCPPGFALEPQRPLNLRLSHWPYLPCAWLSPPIH